MPRTILTTLGRVRAKAADDQWAALCASRGIDPIAFDDNKEISLAVADAASIHLVHGAPSA